MVPSERPEIDYRTMKLIVGLIALGLSALTAAFAQNPLASISHAYCAGGGARDVFVGCLFAIAAIMAAHNGVDVRELFASKAVSAAAVSIAVFPTDCSSDGRALLHVLSACLMFALLAWFCLSFARRTYEKPHQAYAARRRIAYTVCGSGIVLCMAGIGAVFKLKWWSGGNAVFVFEAIALALFGVSWMIASHFLPYFEHRDERRSLRLGTRDQGGERQGREGQGREGQV